MKIGVPKEIKVREARVGMIPAGVSELVAEGHAVFVQSEAGRGVGFSDADYAAAGARVATERSEETEPSSEEEPKHLTPLDLWRFVWGKISNKE